MKALRTAMIGCGPFARRHAAGLAALDEIQLVGFCNRTLAAAETFNQEYAGGRGRVYSDYAPMFEELGLDLVYISLPPYAHGNEVSLACQHGIHFLIEKPIALTLELAQSMADDVRASGVKSQVGFMFRHGEAVRQLKHRLHEQPPAHGALMIGQYACNSLHRDWWRDRDKSGGQVVEQIIHLIDLSRYLLGEPAQVFSMQDNLFHREVEDYTVEDASATTIRFENGSLAVISATNGAIPGRWDSSWRVIAPGLTADFSDANHAVFHDTGRAEAPAKTVAADQDLYLAETLDLLAAIREDRPTAAPIEEGVRSLALALAARRSSELNVPINLGLPDPPESTR